ncbi:MAG: SufE family protein [Fimbriimonadaceae bacterium]|nr:SufE family protein [Fimbriimonadaceae bacterium]
MSSLTPRLTEILENLEFFPDRADRIQFLISFAERFVPIEPARASLPYPEAHRVPGCESEAFAWVFADGQGGVQCRYDVLNPQGISAQAMAVILRDGLEGASPSQVAAVPDDLVYSIFGRELSMGKTAGLMGMIGLTKALARRLTD